SSIFYSDLTDQTSKLLSNSDGIDEISLKTSEAATAMGYNDLSHQATTLPNTALILNDEFKLSEEEEESIRKMLSEDAKFDPYEATLEIIKELLLQETEMNGFYESVTISEKIISEFIQASKLAESGRLLQFLKTLENRIRKDKPLWAERLKDAWVTAGSRDRLKILAEALNNYSQISSTELRKYLSNFGWEALNGITDLIEQVEHQHHKDCLSEHLTEKGRDHINIIGKGIFDKRLEVVHNSIKVLATIGNDKALNYLQKVASHNDDSVRRNLVLALRYCPNKNALAILKKAAGDSIPEIRKDAVEAIINRRGRPAFEAITEIINNDNFSALEQNDQQALLNAFSILGGDKAVGFLVSLILNYNYFRNPVQSFFRKAAFNALSLNRSEKCELTLIKLTRSWRPEIKRLAQNAIHKRRENIYGDRQ
ncbi:MAG: HEAT repeat domain-containing protein, partial [Candidatus Zixiibacteriota bacterium]